MLASEHRLCRALPAGLLALAALTFAFNTFVDATSNRLRCFVPQEFTTEWANYADTKCSELNGILQMQRRGISFPGTPTRAVKSDTLAKAFSGIYATPFLLLTVAFLLTVPVGVRQLLDRCLRLMRSQNAENQTNESALPIACLLVAQFVLVVSIGVSLGLVENFTATKLDFSARQEAGAILVRSDRIGFTNGNFSTYFCDFEAKKLGKNVLYTLQCAISQRAVFVAARLSALATWAVLVFYLVWSCASLLLNALLFISPTARRNFLSGPNANRKTEASVPLQPLKSAL